MKSIVSNETCDKKELPYPKLMKGVNSGAIYLMVGHQDGTVVGFTKTYSGMELGEKNTHMAMRNMRDYTGSVYLQNDEV